jgi:hypothetical protein
LADSLVVWMEYLAVATLDWMMDVMKVELMVAWWVEL